MAEPATVLAKAFAFVFAPPPPSPSAGVPAKTGSGKAKGKANGKRGKGASRLSGLTADTDSPTPHQAARAALRAFGEVRQGTNEKYRRKFCEWLQTSEQADAELHAMLVILEPRVQPFGYSIREWADSCSSAS